MHQCKVVIFFVKNSTDTSTNDRAKISNNKKTDKRDSECDTQTRRKRTDRDLVWTFIVRKSFRKRVGIKTLAQKRG